jgi:hypothetical protein
MAVREERPRGDSLEQQRRLFAEYHLYAQQAKLPTPLLGDAQLGVFLEWFCRRYDARRRTEGEPCRH